jgi:polysaccharide export outer membrane protein
MNKIKVKTILYTILIITITLSSCTSHKKLVYLRNVDSKEVQENYYVKTKPDYKIHKQDILYIKVLTLDEEISNVFNQAIGYQQNYFQNETSLFINGYVVNDSGDVELPVVGEIGVEGLTLDEAKTEIEKQAAVYLKDATIVVKLISFKFTVLGEVSRPGMYHNSNNQLTVMEAIGMAGDITDFGNRRKVLVLRPTKEGTNTYRLDLTSNKILTSTSCKATTSASSRAAYFWSRT